MLKIKDNVDLKELENFGFVDCEKINSMNVFYATTTSPSHVEIGKKNRKIWITGFADEELIPVYNLIKADLVEVEKVSD